MRQEKLKAASSANSIIKYFSKREDTSKSGSDGRPTLPVKRVSQIEITPPLKEEPTTPSKRTLHTLLHCDNQKSVSLCSILSECPRVRLLMDKILMQSGLSENILQRLLLKFFRSNQYLLWGDKYSPTDSADLFTLSNADKIKMWIVSFFRYRKNTPDVLSEASSFINDYEEQISCSLHLKKLQFNWKHKALILKGRAGVGKTATLKAVIEQLKMQLQVCDNNYNQTKYLKEKNESLKSYQVNGVTNLKSLPDPMKPKKNSGKKKSDTKIQDSKDLTKFFPVINKSKEETKAKKAQLMRGVDLFPAVDHNPETFYKSLTSCIESSKIPFILTLGSSQNANFPKQFQGYDVIEFQEADSEAISKHIWAILHIQGCLRLDRHVEVKEGQLFKQINRQIHSKEFSTICTLEQVQAICALFSNRLDYILTYFQFRIGVKSKQFQAGQMLTHCTGLTLIRQVRHFRRDNLYEYLQICQANTQTGENQEAIPPDDDSRAQLQQKTQDCILRALNDHQATDFRQHQQMEQEGTLYMNIPISSHHDARRRITKDIRNKICEGQHMLCSIKKEDLHLLPLLVSQKRQSRKSRESLQETQKKVIGEQESDYLSQFETLRWDENKLSSAVQ